MKIIYYPAAKEDIFSIFDTTWDKWGEEQANKYVNGLYDTIKLASLRQKVWRNLLSSDIKDITENKVYFVSYNSHYIFFRELPKRTGIGVMRVLHEKMNIPCHLQEAMIDIHDNTGLK